MYSLTGTSAEFDCLAQAEAEDTGNVENLDMLVYFNGEPIDRFSPPPGLSLRQVDQMVAGLFIKVTGPQHNNASVYCKVEDSEGEGLFTRTALLIVAGEPIDAQTLLVFVELHFLTLRDRRRKEGNFWGR